MNERAKAAFVEPIWRSDYANSCFSAFHPFFVMPGMTPSRTTSHRYGFKFQPDEGLSRPEIIALYAHLSEDAAADQLAFWSSVKREGTRMTWAEARARFGISDTCEFRKVLWSAVEGSLDDDVRAAGEALAAAADAAGIFLPSSTEIQPAMEQQIGQAFMNAGFTEVIMTSEIRDYEVRITVDDLMSSTPISALVPASFQEQTEAPGVQVRLPIWVPSELYAPDKSLKCSVAWESIVTEFLGTKEALLAARLDELLEGEWRGEPVSSTS